MRGKDTIIEKVRRNDVPTRFWHNELLLRENTNRSEATHNIRLNKENDNDRKENRKNMAHTLNKGRIRVRGISS